VSATRNRHIEEYLDDLRAATRDLPRRRRDELVADIEEHITATVPFGATDADVLTALDRIGDPDQIAAAERERLGIVPTTPGWLEWLTIPLLLVGALIIPLVGWLVGVIFLWLSRCWSVRDKVIGTLVVPGGLAGALLLPLYPVSVQTCSSGTKTSPSGRTVSFQHCTGGQSTVATIAWITLELALIVAPVATAVYLTRRARALR